MKGYRLLILLACFLYTGLCTKAQDSLLIPYLMERIAAQQAQADPFFTPGIFPSYISKQERYHTQKKDNNIFFNGLIAYTLSDIKPALPPALQAITDSILRTAKPAFIKFKNAKGRDTYNFWRTDSVYDYPYAGALKIFAKDISLPDDMDDTVLSLLALEAGDSTAAAIHDLMQQFVNSDTNRVRSITEAYNALPAYSTWFGKKFPVVFDVSVLCNVLSFVQRYQLAWTKADTASLQVIVKTIEQGDHFSKAVYASPYYPKASLILYHVARLMAIRPIPELEKLKVKIVADAGKIIVLTDNLLEKIICSSTILKLGYKPPDIKITLSDIEKQVEQNDFCFFVGNVPSYFRDFYKAYATAKHIGFFYHYCPAYNDALLLEYLLLNKEK